MAKDKLMVVPDRWVHRIQWWIAEDGDMGAYLGERRSDGKGDPPKKAIDLPHWTACKAARETNPKRDTSGFYWESANAAGAALRVVKAALAQERPLPDWAIKATAEKWTPPKGWKA